MENDVIFIRIAQTNIRYECDSADGLILCIGDSSNNLIFYGDM